MSQHRFAGIDLLNHDNYYAPGKVGILEHNWNITSTPVRGQNRSRLVRARRNTVTLTLEIDCLGDTYSTARLQANAIYLAIDSINKGTSAPYIEQFQDESVRTFTILWISKIKETDRDLSGSAVVVLQIEFICDGTFT